ncbi:unnamed protein product [Amoebophrya sp. A25]|nr:unnamed protein product [Amoebophrya sp. A25]|eukprot:GSA25T00000512001.1
MSLFSQVVRSSFRAGMGGHPSICRVGLLSRSIQSAPKSAFGGIRRRFSSGMSEEAFWTSPDLIGKTFLVLLFAFPLYRYGKDIYWTQCMRSLNRSEVIQDRYDWLQRSMLQDEVAEVVSKQAQKYEIIAA